MFSTDPIFTIYLEAYSNSLIQKLIQKYQQENPGLGEDSINFYIKRFDEIKTSPKLTSIASNLGIKNPRDITLYSWKQLEQVVDQFPVKSKEQISHHADNADLIYNQNNLEIYKADTKEKCIYYGQQHFGHQYSFCISRPRDGNMYDEYREEGRTFYFVRDLDKDIRSTQWRDQLDAWHLIVIHATPDPDEFGLTNAPNTGDSDCSWEEIEKVCPKLKGLKHLFKFVPFNEQETKSYRLKHWRPSKFAYLTGEEQLQFIDSDYLLVDKYSYVSMPGQWKMKYIQVRKDLSNMLVDQSNTGRLKEIHAYDAFKFIRNDSEELGKLAYNLSAEIARSGDDANWVYAKNALINIYADYSGEFQTVGGGYVKKVCYLIDMISWNEELNQKGLLYYPDENTLVDDASGEEWKIENEMVVRSN